jgi:hypothetical protein
LHPPATHNHLPPPLMRLTLLLLVFCVGADHPHDPFSANDLTIFTDSSDTRSNFHDSITLLVRGLFTGES